MVTYVESFGAELELNPLPDVRRLEQREVQRFGWRPGHVLDAQIAARERRGNGVGPDVEPLVGRTPPGRRLVRLVSRYDIRLAPAPDALAPEAVQSVDHSPTER